MFVQYNPANGRINATVTSQNAPDHEHQIEVPDGTNVSGKMVNLETYALEDAPPDEVIE